MHSEDLRYRYTSPDADFAIKTKLSTEPPLDFDRDIWGAEASGLDCLVQLIRHTHSQPFANVTSTSSRGWPLPIRTKHNYMHTPLNICYMASEDQMKVQPR
ncbi:hypothetical protein AK830_g7309 [Neonectria ditissima]|uniref:Uncharacterized protein n=1 Tax=Neonectria ditissima TaxID=78410 RepID=A0A0P7AXF0_9HYPO|nr:hypothetical protein AK830_g7309 [Neonectria ditissima]